MAGEYPGGVTSEVRETRKKSIDSGNFQSI